jgi:hypothetical protein
MIFGLARWMALRTWAAVLWWMRRPWIKRLRRRAVDAQRARGISGWRSIAVQDQFAMRHGRRLLTLSFAALVSSIYFVSFYTAAVKLVELGVLQPPESASAQTFPDRLRASRIDLRRQ